MKLLNMQGQLRTPVLQNPDGTFSLPWKTWFVTALVPLVNDRTPLTIPGPFANDAAAAAGGIAVGSLYYDASGVPHVRIT